MVVVVVVVAAAATAAVATTKLTIPFSASLLGSNLIASMQCVIFRAKFLKVATRQGIEMLL
jgi:hypothetical protein